MRRHSRPIWNWDGLVWQYRKYFESGTKSWLTTKVKGSLRLHESMSSQQLACCFFSYVLLTIYPFLKEQIRSTRTGTSSSTRLIVTRNSCKMYFAFERRWSGSWNESTSLFVEDKRRSATTCSRNLLAVFHFTQVAARASIDVFRAHVAGNLHVVFGVT